MNKLLLPALAGLIMVATPVVAQSEFDGLYAGATGAYSLGIVDVGPVAEIQDFRGIGGGAFIGYGTSFDVLYLGVEGGVEYGDIGASGTTFDATRQETASVTARVGFTPTEESMFFLQGGMAFARWEVADGSTSTEWVNSYRIGVGAEQFVTNDMFARVSFDFDLPQEAVNFSPATLETTASTARIGLGFKF